MITKERLQEIKEGDYLLHGTEEWTNQEDADTEAVILELICALEASQQQLAEAQEEAKKLQGMLLIMEIGCPLCGDNLVQYLTDELDVWCSACESNYAGMVVDEI